MEHMLRIETIEDFLNSSNQVIRCSKNVGEKLLRAISIHRIRNYSLEESGNEIIAKFFIVESFQFDRLYHTFESLLLEE